MTGELTISSDEDTPPEEAVRAALEMVTGTHLGVESVEIDVKFGGPQHKPFPTIESPGIDPAAMSERVDGNAAGAEEEEEEEEEFECPACGAVFGSFSSLQGHAGSCNAYDPEIDSISDQNPDPGSTVDTGRRSDNYKRPTIGEVQHAPPVDAERVTPDSNPHIALISLAWLIEDTDTEWACSHEVADAPWCPFTQSQVSSALSSLWRRHGCLVRKGASVGSCEAAVSTSGYEIRYKLSDHGEEEVVRLGEFAWPEGADRPDDPGVEAVSHENPA